MRVFITGATGFIGSAIIPELLNAGHQVLGLTRSDEGEKFLRTSGAEVLRGEMSDLESLERGASISNGVIHAAFNHDFSNFVENCELDRRAIEAIGSALEGSNKPFIITSGLPLPLSPNSLTSEEDDVPSDSGGSPRVSEQTAMTLVERNINASVVRMSQAHDINKQGLATFMMAIAREKNVSAYVGDGLNQWAAVHRLDAASLYRLALEKGSAGAKYHAVSEESIHIKDIAEAIGRRLNIPVVALSSEEAKHHFGWLGFPVSMDAPASSVLTRQRLGWQPKEKSGFLANLELNT
tara:strand:- start:63303 stop:64187 length:885 start_codon:yes stop_codon:yes gene_type:complete